MAGSIMHAAASDIAPDGPAKCDLLHKCSRTSAGPPCRDPFLWQHQDRAADRNSDYDASGNQIAAPFSRSVGESRAQRGRGDRHPRAGEAQQ